MSVRRLSWVEVLELAEALRAWHAVEGRVRVYGVPRGGCVVAALVGLPVDDPAEADLIVDDLIDSGRTRDRFRARYPAVPFGTLLVKTDPTEWVEFPWEAGEAPAEDAVCRLLQASGHEGRPATPGRVLGALQARTAFRDEFRHLAGWRSGR